jgi:hypothetical protein
MKNILAITLALSLGGCATPFGTTVSNLVTNGVANPVSNDQLAGVISSYGVAQTAAIGYMGLPRCTKTNNFSATNICSKRSVKVVIQAADREASQAINAAVAFTRANPTLDATAVINIASAAVDKFNQIETTYGVK